MFILMAMARFWDLQPAPIHHPITMLLTDTITHTTTDTAKAVRDTSANA